MSEAESQITVRSHVARDLLQNAALFKTDRLVVWEYVSNSLQYVDPGVSPVVRVTVDRRRKRIAVEDNGRGMDWAGLGNFFVMHGENIDRKAGRPGRGRFGTGKSAAFGIADALSITSVKHGKRSAVSLSRESIASMTSEAPVPVQTLEREVRTEEPNGTKVEIAGIHLRTIDQTAIIGYIERHLRYWRTATVFVNNHECEYTEPPVATERRIRPDKQLAQVLGDVELVLKISKIPLDEDDRGIQICANGVWHETTLAGSEGRDMSQYISGELDVPRLDQDDSPIPPFDLSRSMRLNPSNELAQAIYAFIGPHIEAARRTLADADRNRRATEEARKLAEQAADIERIINDDFAAWRRRLSKVKAAAIGGTDIHRTQTEAGDEDIDLIFGEELPAEVVSPEGGTGSGTGTARGGKEPPDLAPQVEPAGPDAGKKGQPAGGDGRQRRPRGGFRVAFDSMGLESHRARYVRDDRTIYVNLDHPQVAAAKGGGAVEAPTFKRLAYEIAFSEYAVSLASELAHRNEYIDPSDPIFDIRETLNRVARKAAFLYAE